MEPPRKPSLSSSAQALWGITCLWWQQVWVMLCTVGTKEEPKTGIQKIIYMLIHTLLRKIMMIIITKEQLTATWAVSSKPHLLFKMFMYKRYLATRVAEILCLKHSVRQLFESKVTKGAQRTKNHLPINILINSYPYTYRLLSQL